MNLAILQKWVPYSQRYLFNAIPDTNHNANPTNPNYIHFGPWSLRSFFKGPKCPRTEFTKDLNALTTSALETNLSIV